MTPQDIRPEFAALLSRHGDLIIVLGAESENHSDRVEQADILRTDERQLRARIIAWIPINAAEAHRKLEHLTRFIAATGIGLDRATLDLIVNSTAFFFQTQGARSHLFKSK